MKQKKVYIDHNVYLIIKDSYGHIQKTRIDVDIKECTPQRDLMIFEVVNLDNDIDYGKGIRIGFEISDSSILLEDDNRYNIIFSNQEVDYTDRINYFASYSYSDSKFTLVQ